MEVMVGNRSIQGCKSSKEKKYKIPKGGFKRIDKELVSLYNEEDELLLQYNSRTDTVLSVKMSVPDELKNQRNMLSAEDRNKIKKLSANTTEITETIANKNLEENRVTWKLYKDSLGETEILTYIECAFNFLSPDDTTKVSIEESITNLSQAMKGKLVYWIIKGKSIDFIKNIYSSVYGAEYVPNGEWKNIEELKKDMSLVDIAELNELPKG